MESSASAGTYHLHAEQDDAVAYWSQEAVASEKAFRKARWSFIPVMMLAAVVVGTAAPSMFRMGGTAVAVFVAAEVILVTGFVTAEVFRFRRRSAWKRRTALAVEYLRRAYAL